MKKHTILLAILVLGLTLFAQEIQEKAVAINIEVPVRVFKGKTFIDNLTIDDFEIYEDGVLQKIEAVYLIKKMDIVREDTEMKKEEARKIFAPEVSRNFVFLFEMHEYLPTVGKAIEFFFNDVFLKGDTLIVVTPSQTYRFNNEVLERLTEKEISKELIGQLRKDLRLSSSVYRGLLNDLENLRTFEGSGAFGSDLVRLMHSDILAKIKSLRYIDENKMLNFADTLEDIEGPKHVFFFLQKMLVPTIGTNTVFDSGDLRGFEAYMSFDENKIKQMFSSSSITAHMIYVTKVSDLEFLNRDGVSLTSTNIMNAGNPPAPREMQNLSGNFFSAFKDIAQATGGTVDSTTNVAASFKKAVDASENYYLLYYSPKNYVANGKYKEIKIKVKGQRYKISHRAGYIADKEASPNEKSENVFLSAQIFSQTDNPKSEDQEELEIILKKSAEYCERLANSALHFVCEETIYEELNHGHFGGDRVVTSSGGNISMRSSPGWRNIERNKYVYDYQLIKKGEKIEESRILLKENGKKKHEENAVLKTKRFYSKRSVFGPVGLLGKEQQGKYNYKIIKEQTIKKRKTYVIEVTPKINIEGNPNFGKVWVDKEDFSVLKIEIEQESLAGFEKIEEESKNQGVNLVIKTTHEYFIEKNGIRFPSMTSCKEVHITRIRRVRTKISETTITYDNYRFFLVDVKIKY